MINKFFNTIAIVVSLIVLSASVVYAQTTTTPAEPADEVKDLTFPITELGGCSDYSSCLSFCDDPVNHSGCIDYAKKKGFYQADPAIAPTDDFISKAKGTLGCDSAAACAEFCSQEANFDKCDQFAKSQKMDGGYVDSPDKKEYLDKAKEVLGCDSAAACSTLCSDSANHDRCSQFADQVGLLGGNIAVGPGGCQSEESCQLFCSDPANFNSCAQFAPDKGKFEGPGSCNSPESCRTYCEQNPEQCRSYSPGSNGVYVPAVCPAGQFFGPGGTCTKPENYQPAMGCSQGGGFWAGDACVINFNEVPPGIHPTVGGAYYEPRPEMGNCKTPGECYDFCKENAGKCPSFDANSTRPTDDYIPSLYYTPGTDVTFTPKPEMGNCNSPGSCYDYCKDNPDKCQGFDSKSPRPLDVYTPLTYYTPPSDGSYFTPPATNFYVTPMYYTPPAGSNYATPQYYTPGQYSTPTYYTPPTGSNYNTPSYYSPGTYYPTPTNGQYPTPNYPTPIYYTPPSGSSYATPNYYTPPTYTSPYYYTPGGGYNTPSYGYPTPYTSPSYYTPYSGGTYSTPTYYTPPAGSNYTTPNYPTPSYYYPSPSYSYPSPGSYVTPGAYYTPIYYPTPSGNYPSPYYYPTPGSTYGYPTPYGNTGYTYPTPGQSYYYPTPSYGSYITPNYPTPPAGSTYTYPSPTGAYSYPSPTSGGTYNYPTPGSSVYGYPTPGSSYTYPTPGSPYYYPTPSTTYYTPGYAYPTPGSSYGYPSPSGTYYSYPTPSNYTYPTPTTGSYSSPYISPAYGSPSYGTPAYGSPSYGTPAYGTPEYATPSYGTPSYETPSYSYPTPGETHGVSVVRSWWDQLLDLFK